MREAVNGSQYWLKLGHAVSGAAIFLVAVSVVWQLL